MADVRRAVALLLALVLSAGCGTKAPDPPARPERIASLILSADEMLAGLVDPGRVVAVSFYADSEESSVAGRWSADLPRLRPDIERLVALRPDLIVLADYSNPEARELLAKAGLPVLTLKLAGSHDGILEQLQRLADAVGEPDNGRRMAAEFRSRKAALAGRVGAARGPEGRRPRVLYWAGGYTAGADTSVQDCIVNAGGENVAAGIGRGTGHFPISAEQAVASAPEWLLLSAPSHEEALRTARADGVLRRLPAVEAGRVIGVPARLLGSVSHHAIGAAEVAADRLWGPTGK